MLLTSKTLKRVRLWYSKTHSKMPIYTVKFKIDRKRLDLTARTGQIDHIDRQIDHIEQDKLILIQIDLMMHLTIDRRSDVHACWP